MTNPKAQSDPRPLTKAEVFRQGEQKILQAHPKIVDALIEQARKGSYQHAKFLFDLVDAVPTRPKDDDGEVPGPSLAEIVMERLQLVDPQSPNEGASPERVARA